VTLHEYFRNEVGRILSICSANKESKHTLKDNKADFTNKIEKVVKKSIKRIVKKTASQIKLAFKQV
jgi:hypothetical protein